MPGKRACLIVNLRSGRTVVKVPALITALAAAGWKTDVSLKEYSGETLALARQAASDGHDLVMGYGGDGTLNAVINGVLYAGGRSSIGDIPGGTFNEWAGEINLPRDPVKAALALLESVPCPVDLGFLQVEGLTVPASLVQARQREHADHDEHEEAARPGGSGETEELTRLHAKPKKAGKHRQYFLLHVGLGVDAAIMAHINKPLKYELGKLAFDLAGLKELPRQRPFPVEICSLTPSGKRELLWQGDAWQVVVNNTRRYAGTIDLSPEAYIDDGVLDVTVIPAGGPLATLEEAVSFLLMHTIDTSTTRDFRGPHLSIGVPASIEVELDGSVIKLNDFLRKKMRETLQRAGDADQVMVHYRFDAVPAAARMAFPCTYDGSMFEKPAHKKPFERAAQQRKQREEQLAAQQEERQQNGQAGEESSNPVKELQRRGRTITVVGVAHLAHHSSQPDTYIIAGTYGARNDAQLKPAAVRVDGHTLLLNHRGEQLTPLLLENLREGEQITVEGKKSKRGVIDAGRILMF